MAGLSQYLSIAGLAWRRAAELRSAQASEEQFPEGDQTFTASEVATCEAVVSCMKGVLALHYRLLEFSPEGRAIARIPEKLCDLITEDPTLYET